ncbi:S8 family serine peptidase [Streptomyces sp. 11-1-2]|uniref:S8 family serine peptidase n=1 Tax=unclassified Streptomyces TaxID=2593676 RepID=UPI001F09FBE9|nr:S8 family serine peptidase [Streptomyces sp. 11-1-2]
MEATVTLACKKWRVVVSLLASMLVVGGAMAPSAAAETMRQRQWYLDRMQAERVWKVSTGRGITVAVLDGGVNASVPELKGKVLKGRNFAEPKKDARQDPDGHGTAMAMLIAGNGMNGQGIKGLAPDTRILPLAVAGTTKESGTRNVRAFADAIRYAADSDARILNISMGYEFYTLESDERDQIQRAVDYAISRGKLLFAASGNNATDGNEATYPAASTGVAGIGAVDDTFTVAKFSTYGPQVALAAAGDEIPIRCLDGKPGYCRSGGTSQATAVTSASAALIWAKHPSWTGNQVLRVMIQTAAKPSEGKVPSRYIGYGTVRPRINLLDGKGDPGPANVNPLVKANDPSPSASKGSEPSASSKSEAAAPADSLAADKDEGGSVTPWVIGGVAVVVVAAGGLFVVLRRRSGMSV